MKEPAGGRVFNWTPTVDQIGNFYRFEVQADNLNGSDTETWQVRVLSRADLDQDGDVDQSDFGLFQSCISGTGAARAPGCADADLDRDEDVDSHDLDAFVHCIAGSGNPPAG